MSRIHGHDIEAFARPPRRHEEESEPERLWDEEDDEWEDDSSGEEDESDCPGSDDLDTWDRSDAFGAP